MPKQMDSGPCSYTQSTNLWSNDLQHRKLCNYTDLTHLLTQKRYNAELAQLANPQWTVYTQNGHLSTTDRLQGQETSDGQRLMS